MPSIGAHVSIAPSFEVAVDHAQRLGCSTFQIFSRSPRMWRVTPIPEAKAQLFRERRRQANIAPAVVHMPYLPNLASSDSALHRRSSEELLVELQRAAVLGCEMVVVHMGSHTGKGREQGLAQVIQAIRFALDKVSDQGSVKILLENTAGQQNSVGDTFEDLRFVLDKVDSDPDLGICFDTCHAFAAGYDLRSPAAVSHVLDTLNHIIGLDRLKAIHLNDAKGELGGHLDRHEHIGLGAIGETGFKAILTHPKLTGVPMILETPIDERGDMASNLQTLRRLMEQ